MVHGHEQLYHAGHRVVELDVLRAVLGEHRDTRSRRSECTQHAGHEVDAPLELGERRRARLGDECQSVGHAPRCVGEQAIDECGSDHAAWWH